jgi:hypothetical protein
MFAVGFSQEKCNNFLFSDNPGGACTTVSIAGVVCPKIQDPDKTYNNPGAALEESKRKIQQGEAAIQGFERLYPPGSLGR